MISKEETLDNQNNPKEGLFSHTDDFNSLSEVAKNYPTILEKELKDKEDYLNHIKIANKEKDIIPLFIKTKKGDLTIISSFNEEIDTFEKGGKLVYLGKSFDSLGAI